VSRSFFALLIADPPKTGTVVKKFFVKGKVLPAVK
jgi:hypothetical protein